MGEHQRASGIRRGNIIESGPCQRVIGDVGRCYDCTQREPRSVDDDFELLALAALREANFIPSFFALMNVASITNLSRCRLPKLPSSSINAVCTPSKTPSPAHSISRRHQVLPDGKSTAISCHRAPVRRSHRIPSKLSRSETRDKRTFGDQSVNAVRRDATACSSVGTRFVIRALFGSLRLLSQSIPAKLPRAIPKWTLTHNENIVGD